MQNWKNWVRKSLGSKLKYSDSILKQIKVKNMAEKKARFPNTKAALKVSLNKQIDGKTMIAIAVYLIFKFWSFKYPGVLDPILSLSIDVGIWVICLLFNIDNPSVGKVFRDIGQFLWDLALEPENAIKEMRIWYAALGQRYMIEFDKLGEKISDGVIKVPDSGSTMDPKFDRINK